jgi:hypothetical protein
MSKYVAHLPTFPTSAPLCINQVDVSVDFEAPHNQITDFFMASVTSSVLSGWSTGGQCRKRTLVVDLSAFPLVRLLSASEQ